MAKPSRLFHFLYFKYITNIFKKYDTCILILLSRGNFQLLEIRENAGIVSSVTVESNTMGRKKMGRASSGSALITP
jgi:hypothetical protein